MRVFFALTYFLFILVHDAESDCLFPSDLTGDWYSSIKGLLNISSSATTTAIPSFSTTQFGTISLTCYVSSGSNYVFKSAAFSYLNLQFEVFACFVLSTKVSSSKYIYHMGSVENTDAANERLKVYLVSSATTPTVALACDRSSYAAGTEHVFLKNDGAEANSRIAFPYIYWGWWTYIFTSSGTAYCSSDSGVNVCNNPDTSTMVYNYTACATVQAYSAGGQLLCMWTTSDSSYTYMTVYNTDGSTDESTTYRFTCYVIAKTGTTIYATQYPRQCLSSQTSTSVTSPGAAIVYTKTGECPYDETSTVLSTASTAGIVIGILLLIAIIICGVLVWYYYKKRKEREALDKLPLQKSQPANKRLHNGDLFRDGKSRDGRLRDSKTPRTMSSMNGDVRVNMDTDPDIRRENSICISMNSRGGSGFGNLDVDRKGGPAPVEEPEKVNYISDDVIEESENEAALASTFLPISADVKNELHFTDEEIREIEKNAVLNEEDEEKDEFDMDDIDDELGLPRLSRAFTPVMPPPIPDSTVIMPTISYRKPETDSESGEERTAGGVLKVKLKKRKKKRVKSSKGNLKGARPKSGSKSRLDMQRETPFLERIKKMDNEKAEMEQREKLEKELKEIENGVIKARLAKSAQSSATPPGSKYVVDSARNKKLRPPNKGVVPAQTQGEQRRRFGDPPSENTRKNRKKTPRLRHPMELQGDSEEIQDKNETLQKAEEFWKEEKRARSGRRREHPEALTIPSVKEDPFDHKDGERPTTTSAFSQARSGKSAFGVRLDRENSAFIDPPKDPTEAGDVWNKVSNMWHFKNQIWGNNHPH